MKRSIVARKPARTVPVVNADPSAPEPNLAADVPQPAASKEKKWEIDGPESIPAPVIRANMISFRVSYQGRVQVAFFEEAE